jgi:peptidoglycan/xylan/chitin deacetylase (PgdA/CDA1 family)
MPDHETQCGIRQVKLTFDDGPDPTTTPELLDHLAALGLKATFFVLGHRIENQPGRALIKRMAAEGHQIGNHSYSHPNLTERGSEEIESEITITEQLIGALDGGVKLFRPPFGFHNELVNDLVKKLGYRMVLWNVTSRDWLPYYANRRWVLHAMRQIKANMDCIVLAHDVFPSTVSHVPELVKTIRDLPDTEFGLVS